MLFAAGIVPTSGNLATVEKMRLLPDVSSLEVQGKGIIDGRNVRSFGEKVSREVLTSGGWIGNEML